MACAAIVNNVVVSSSCQTLDPPPAPLLECIAMPTPADYAEHDACEKAKRKKTCQGAKKGKKGSVHVPPLDPSLKGKNVQVKFFDTDMSEEQNVSLDTYLHCHFMEIANDLLDQDPSGQKLVKVLNNTKKVDTYDPYLDAPSDGEQDSSSEDEEEGQSP